MIKWCNKLVNRIVLSLLYTGVNGVNSNSSSSVIDHPLALSNDSPLPSPGFEDYPTNQSTRGSFSGGSSSSMSKSSSFHAEKSRGIGHGMCLTASDQDRIRIFIHEFAVRALIPWAERQMKTLNDLVWILIEHYMYTNIVI